METTTILAYLFGTISALAGLLLIRNLVMMPKSIAQAPDADAARKSWNLSLIISVSVIVAFALASWQFQTDWKLAALFAMSPLVLAAILVGWMARTQR